jgi:ribosome-binding factor A
MSIDRLTRVNEMLKREIGTAIYHVMREDAFDLAAVTVTEVSASHDLRTARVRVSIRGTDDRQASMLHLLKRHHGDFQALINRAMQIKYTPRLTFELDGSVAKGDHVLSILQHWAPAADAGAADLEPSAGAAEAPP